MPPAPSNKPQSSKPQMTKAIRVLVVDDSASVRETLKEIIDADPEMAVMGVAADPFVAVRRIAEEVPDVIILDLELPRMDGVTFLRKIMDQCPVPVVMCAFQAEEQLELAEAMAAGAVEVIYKSRLNTRQFLLDTRDHIRAVIRAAAGTEHKSRTVRAVKIGGKNRLLGAKKLSADVMLPPFVPTKPGKPAIITDKVVCIGASTGGTESLRVLLEMFPIDAPATVIVQHMPEKFTETFANRLNGLCAVAVKEARDGDAVLRGQVLIAPGNRHLLLRRSGNRYYVELRDGPLVTRHRPSVDVLFRSAARYVGANGVGVLMTGMGDDGARGLLEMFQAGAHTIAEDESTCVVFGMPREAIKLGAARKVVPLTQIKDEILRVC
ncbi:protein-glutamate methylesterase/protein glutamine deamidase [uncultured Gammaproteobacteria bacterium]